MTSYIKKGLIGLLTALYVLSGVAQAQLIISELTGFNAGGGIERSINFLGGQGLTTDLTTYSYTVDLGIPQADRIIAVVVYGSRGSGTPATLSSVSINGVAAASQVSVTNGASISAIWTAVVPTGSSGVTLSTTFGQAQNRAGISVYSMYGMNSATATDASTDIASPFAAAGFDVQAGGAAIGGGTSENATATSTWTGLTENYDANVDGARTFTSASQLFATAQTGLSSTVAYTTSNNPTAIWAAFR